MAEPDDLDGRTELLYGAYLAGVSLGTTGTGLHHKLCHVLGGTFNLVHADTHSVILPHAVAFNGPALPDEMARLAEALGVPGRRSGGRAVGPRRGQPRADLAGRPRPGARTTCRRPRTARGGRDHGQPRRRSTRPRSPASSQRAFAGDRP